MKEDIFLSSKYDDENFDDNIIKEFDDYYSLKALDVKDTILNKGDIKHKHKKSMYFKKYFKILLYLDKLIQYYLFILQHQGLQINVEKTLFNRMILKILIEKKKSVLFLFISNLEQTANIQTKKSLRTIEHILELPHSAINYSMAPLNMFINQKYLDEIVYVQYDKQYCDNIKDDFLKHYNVHDSCYERIYTMLYEQFCMLLTEIYEKKWKFVIKLTGHIDKLYQDVIGKSMDDIFFESQSIIESEKMKQNNGNGNEIIITTKSEFVMNL